VGERFTKHFGIEIIDGIGSTEVLHIYLSNRPGVVRYGTTGKAVEGYEIELRDDRGGRVASGEIGSLWVKGPSTALMYWNDRSKTRDTFQGAWLRSGDKYVCNAEGYYTYAGRNDDMLKISGQYISPFEVESVLMAHQAVLESGVVGVTDASGLAKSKAYIVLRNGFAPSEALGAELKSFVKERLAPFKRPHQVEFIAELPKTATGKVQRFKLRELSLPSSDAKSKSRGTP
jgi:benzoate-CoA ligase